MKYHNEKFRIKRSRLQEEKMKFLIDNRIFAGYADILALSAILGYKYDRNISIDLQASDPVQLNFFSREDRLMINLIAYAHKGEQAVLDSNSNEKYEIYESYANGGFPILWEHLELNVEEDIGNVVEVFNKLLLGLKVGFNNKSEEYIDNLIA